MPAPTVRRRKGQALIWFNARHDGITLEAVGDVVLTAANPASPIDARQASRRSSTTSSISATACRRRPCCVVSGSPAPTTSRPAPASDRPSNPTTSGRRRSSTRRRRHQNLCAVVSDHRARRSLRQLHQPMRRRRICRAPRPDAGRRDVPRLHLPRQPHANRPARVRPPARQPRRRSTTACSWQHRRTWAWTTSACSRRRISPGARIGRDDGV